MSLELLGNARRGRVREGSSLGGCLTKVVAVWLVGGLACIGVGDRESSARHVKRREPLTLDESALVLFRHSSF